MPLASRQPKKPHLRVFFKGVRAACVLGFALAGARAGAQTAATPTDDQRAKLVDYFSENFSLVEKVLELYRARFVAAAPIFEAAGVELPASLGGTVKPAEVPPPPREQNPPVQPQPTPSVRRSPFREVHIEPSGPLNGAHLDGHVPMPDILPTSSPTREDIARRAAYERANIEAYYFFKAMRDRQPPAR